MFARAVGLLPLNFLSRLTGALAAVRLPRPLSTWSVALFARCCGIDAALASKPIAEYGSIAEFFTRDLKSGVRSVGEGIVSPVDGTLRSFGEIDAGKIEQVKGWDYSLTELLGDDRLAQLFDRGTYFNLYLSPKDYHHVHFPVDGSVVARMYIPGRLWPVNDWALARIEQLFCKNERLITVMESSAGVVAVVMVGAYNVGRMSLSFDSIATNASAAAPDTKSFNPPVAARRGERLGTFHLGSTVILLFERGKMSPLDSLQAPRPVRMGEAIGG
jgi:phosphatidylserine decarboxylase